jgi:hypothetical protein
MTIDDTDTSEVYGSFRVGGRARMTQVVSEADAVEATLAPYGIAARLTRRVRLRDAAGRLEIVDSAVVPLGHTVRSRLHLHPAVALDSLSSDRRTLVARSAAGRVRITASSPVFLQPGRASRRYGTIEPTTIVGQELTVTHAHGQQRSEGSFVVERLDKGEPCVTLPS